MSKCLPPHTNAHMISGMAQSWASPVRVDDLGCGEAARRKIARRLLPFLFLLYITAFIDRVNVGFAGLDMTRELHFSNQVFGFGAGIFFFGYCLLEIPGAIALAARSGRFCAFVGLGVIIRGETYHFEVVSNESARGIMDLTLQGYAIGNGILTVENEAQAVARCDAAQLDKGGGAAKAALALFELREKYAP